jgi:hypothetical protein
MRSRQYHSHGNMANICLTRWRNYFLCLNDTIFNVQYVLDSVYTCHSREMTAHVGAMDGDELRTKRTICRPSSGGRSRKFGIVSVEQRQHMSEYWGSC